MATAHFKKVGEKHIKRTKPKHHKYWRFLALSLTINIIFILTTLHRVYYAVK